MNSSRREARINKRSSNACQRCRRQKIKCSGSYPCHTCNKRSLACVFDDRDQKILVTRGYIEDLQQQIASVSHGEDGLISPESGELNAGRPPEGDDGTAPGGSAEWSQNPDGPANLINPLSSGPSTFMTAASGRTFYLGTSSNWSFARQILSMTHEYLYHSTLPTDNLHFDGSTYDLAWDGFRTIADSNNPVAPPLDFAIHLINTVKFRACQLFHLFDEGPFMQHLHDFYENPERQMGARNLWYIHYLLILAFGKAFIVQKCQGNRPPGYEFFTKALQLLPGTTYLCEDPVNATEVLCCIALYLQSLDYRIAAHNFIGQAMRIALAQGMHTDMPSEHLGDALIQRCRKIWWTIYVLDRQMTSLVGLPQSIRDNQLHHQLPSFPESSQKVIALRLLIKMCQIMEEINNTVYGPDGRLNRKFLLKTKGALASTAELGNELRASYELRLDETSISGVSRLSAHLHLLYHQCIVLATRPVLLSCLKIRLQSPDASIESLNLSPNVRKLLQVCVDSSRQMINILTVLHGQDLLDSFLPFDLESIFVSAAVIVTAAATDSCLIDGWSSWLQKTYVIFDEMISRGNLIARFRKWELEQLADTSRQLPAGLPTPAAGSTKEGHQHRDIPRPQPPLIADGGINAFVGPEVSGADSGLTIAEIMAVADSIDTVDVDWISHAFAENQTEY